MSSIESYDGLCGKIPTFASSSLRIRCKYDINHRGPCSYEKYKSQFVISGHATEPTTSPEEGFNNSVIYHLKYDHYSIAIASDNSLIIRK